MQMRAGDGPGGAGFDEHLAVLLLFSLVHRKLGEVHVNGEKPLAVVEDDAIAFVEQFASENNSTGVSRENGCARCGAKIDTVMFAEQLTVEHPAHAEGRGNDGVQRLLERSRPQGMWAGLVIGGGLGGSFLVDSLQSFRIGTGETAFDSERIGGGDDFALHDGHADFLHKTHQRSGSGFSLNRQWILTLRCTESRARNADPSTTLVN